MPDQKLCVIWTLLVFDAQYFHMVCQGIGSSQPHASQAHLKPAKTRVSVSFTSFPTTRFRLLRMGPKEMKKCCRLICWCISKNHYQFYSIIYASVVCIKDGLSQTLSCCVFLHLKEAKKWQHRELDFNSSMIQLQSCSATTSSLPT